MATITNSNFNPSLVGRQMTDINDSSILTNNNFNIDEFVISKTSTPSNFSTIKSKQIPIDIKFEFERNFTNPLDYSRYGLLADYYRFEVDDLISKFPYSLYIQNKANKFNIVGYSYNAILNTSTFQIPVTSLVNSGNAIYSDNLNIVETKDLTNNIILNYINYEFNYNNENYDIKEFIGSQFPDEGYITLTISGKIFDENGNYSINAHIKPNCEIFNSFKNNLNNFQKNIIKNNDSLENRYFIDIKDIFEDEEGKVRYVTKRLFLYYSDGYNLDLGDKLAFFSSQLFDIAERYDNYRTDIFYRCILPENLKELDGDTNENLSKLSRSFGNIFDRIMYSIESIANVNKLGYTNVNNAPIAFIPELSKVFGLEYFDIVSDLGKLFDADQDCGVDYSMLNYELYRNILFNGHYLLNNEGSRKPIEFLFRYMGLNECFYVLDEHFYEFERPLNKAFDYVSVERLLTEAPYDSEFYPLKLTGNNVYFQQPRYFDVYRAMGYSIDYTVDNKKSYTYSNSQRLKMNSKELLYGIDAFKGLECEVLKMNSIQLFCEPDCDDVDFTLTLTDDLILDGEDDEVNEGILQNDFYPINIDASELTLPEYLEIALSSYIDARNRKTLNDGNTNGYPSLIKLFYDYYRNSFKVTCLSGTTYSANDALEYTKIMDNTFIKMIRQFIPATSIVLGGGSFVRNTLFARQKFPYKRGIDESSLFENNILDYSFKKDVSSLKSAKSFGLTAISESASFAVSSLVCEVPTAPIIVDSIIENGQVTLILLFEPDLVGSLYYIERIESAECEDVDITLLANGDLLDNGTGSSESWKRLTDGFTEHILSYTDTISISGKPYFYRVTAENPCGSDSSNVLFVENPAIVNNSGLPLGNILSGYNVFKWEITNYNTPPTVGVFLAESGYLLQINSIYYPINYDPNTELGTLSFNQRGYRRDSIPFRVACGDTICPSIFDYDFILESEEANITII